MTRVGTVWLDVALDVEKAGKDLQSFGKSFTANVSAPIAGVGALAVKGFASFEASMARVSGLSGVAREQVQSWTGEVKNIGVEYGVGAQAAADALYFVTSSGIQSADALDVVAESSKASAAGLGEAQTVADLTTSALNAYKDSGLTAANATDILTAAVAAGKGEPAEFASSLGQVLPIASALGVSYAQVAGAEAAMTLRGLDASEATTALRGILTSILKPTKQAEDALAGVGLSSEGLRKQLKDQGLLATLETLTQALGGDAAASAAVFENVRALNGVMNILGENTDETRAVMDQVAHSTGATDKAFESAAQTTEFKMNQALARTKGALIDVGAQLAPVATALGSFVSGAAEKFTQLPQPIQTTAVTVGVLAAGLGPAAYAIGKVTSGAASGAKALSEFAVAMNTANAANASTALGRLGAILGSIPSKAALAGGGIAALAAGYAVLNAKMRDAESIGDPLKGIADKRLVNAKSIGDFEKFIADADAQTRALQERFDNVKFDPVEREAIGSMGAALAESALKAKTMGEQAKFVARETAVAEDVAATWVATQAGLGNEFKSNELALAAYRQGITTATAAANDASSATANLAAASKPLADPFFALQAATKDYAASVRGVASAQQAKEATDRAAVAADRDVEAATRKIIDTEARRQQSLRAVADAQRGVTEAQQALNDALRGPSTDQQLNIESSELALARAKQRLGEIGKTKPGDKSEPVDPLDRREAELSVRRAQNDLDKARAEIAGRVADAQDNLRDAQDKLADSQRSADDAARAVTEAHEALNVAQQAQVDAHQAVVDATTAVSDAQAGALDNARNLAAAQEAWNSALSKAPNLAGPFVQYLENLKTNPAFRDVAGQMQAAIDKLRELQKLAEPNNPYAGLDSNSQFAPIDQPVGGDNARAFGGPVSAGRRYSVTERGAPELYTDGRNQWMIPPVAGQVTALQVAQFDPATMGGNSGPNLVIEHFEVHGPDPVATAERAIVGMSKKAMLAAAR